MVYIGDANDPATIRADVATFFQMYFPADTDADEAAKVVSQFGPNPNLTSEQDPCSKHFCFPQYWDLDDRCSGLIQVHDVVAPVCFDTSVVYLQRLGAIADALFSVRDDIAPFFEDPFRGRMMPAWGAYTENRDCKWNTDVDTSGLFVYAMAAFARRVAERPDRYPPLLRDQAIRMITAVIDTYNAFRPELHLVEGDPHAYWCFPEGYSTLVCSNGNDKTQHDCQNNLKALAGKPLAYNQCLSMIRALTELAPAADSSFYRASPAATPERLQVATGEMPLVIAKTIAWRVADLNLRTLSDGTPCYDWHYRLDDHVEDIGHAQFELGCLAVVLQGQLRLNELLARAGRTERVSLSSSIFERLANTFLRVVWDDNLLAGNIDGSGDHGNTGECAGWVPLAQFDPLVWKRARDTTFNPPSSPDLRPDSHGALLRYRKYNSMKYLTDFAGQNSLITPVALAVGEQPPGSIRDQKWQLILTGVVSADQGDDNGGPWNQQTVSFLPDMAGPDDPTATSGPLNWAIAHYGIPRPPGTVGQQYLVRFSVDEWAPFVSLSSVYDQGPSINAGFAVNDWRPNHFDTGTDAVTNAAVNNIFTGVNADLAVNDTDAWIYKLSYNIALIGTIVFIAPPVIE